MITTGWVEGINEFGMLSKDLNANISESCD